MNKLFILVHLKKKKIEYNEKGQYFLSLVSESETHILYRFITHRVKYFKPLFLEILKLFFNITYFFINFEIMAYR